MLRRALNFVSYPIRLPRSRGMVQNGWSLCVCVGGGVVETTSRHTHGSAGRSLSVCV